MTQLVADADPLTLREATVAVAQCFARTGQLLAHREVHLPRGEVGRMITFADGTTGRVYRETSVDPAPETRRCVLVVCFRLRAVRGWGHRAFEVESLLNTPLFVGFPGFVSKLWLAHDGRSAYRGVYEWDDPALADRYARSLWRVLALVSVRGSIHYVVLPGLRRDAVLSDPSVLDAWGPTDLAAWWRVTGTTPPPGVSLADTWPSSSEDGRIGNRGGAHHAQPSATGERRHAAAESRDCHRLRRVTWFRRGSRLGGGHGQAPGRAPDGALLRGRGADPGSTGVQPGHPDRDV
jgi:hypothetical protein